MRNSLASSCRPILNVVEMSFIRRTILFGLAAPNDDVVKDEVEFFE